MLCYVDESDEGDCFAFAGVVLTPLAVKTLGSALDAIVDHVSRSFAIDRNAEIHGYPMFHGRELWKGMPPRARVWVFNQVVDAILEHADRILLRAVSRRRLEARQRNNNYPENFPPERICVTHILQRVNTIARSRKDYALVIADERHDGDMHRDLFREFQTYGTPGVYMNTSLPHLIDTIHFAPSKHSRAIQAADVLAFLYRRYMTTTESDPRSERAMADLMHKIVSSPKLFDSGSWP